MTPQRCFPHGLAPQRIVSLVPSWTEALFALGLGERVVGCTEWCTQPAEGVRHVRKIGGTKNPKVKAIVELAPDLVIANHEENRRRHVEKLEAAGLRVWLSYPRTVREGLRDFERMVGLAGAPGSAAHAAAAAAVAPCVEALQGRNFASAAALGSGPAPKVWVPIWKDPWMSVG